MEIFYIKFELYFDFFILYILLKVVNSNIRNIKIKNRQLYKKKENILYVPATEYVSNNGEPTKLFPLHSIKIGIVTRHPSTRF